METAERSTGSSHGCEAEQMPLDPAGPSSHTGQYLCMECSESFDTKQELTCHRQSHGGRKQFTCTRCGRGFHHQVFLQMHERSHEDSCTPSKSATSRVISTRSSKMADVVHVRPTYSKPARHLNSVVQFIKDQKAEQAFTPRECVTRRSHGATPDASHRRDCHDKNHFELRIAKFSDSAVHLIDPFGNSIEILTDVFNTYTISEQGDPSAHVGETSPETSEEVPAGEHLEEESAAVAERDEPPLVLPSVASPDPSKLSTEMDSDQIGSAAEVGLTPEEPRPNDATSSNPLTTGSAATPVDEPDECNSDIGVPKVPPGEMVPQPARVSEETTEEAVGEEQPNDLPCDHHAESRDHTPPTEVPASSEAAAPMDNVDAPSASDAANKQSDTEKMDAGGQPGQMDGQTIIAPGGPSLESGEKYMEDPSKGLFADNSGAESLASKRATPEEVTSSTSSESKERSPAPSGGDISPPESQELSKTNRLIISQSAEEQTAINGETGMCVSSQDAGEASMSDVCVTSLDRGMLLEVPEKEPEKSGCLLAAPPLLEDEELGIGDKREADLFERDIFQLEPPVGVPMVCDRGAHSSMMVHNQEDDVGLDGGNMKYISESEMIRLLEQDKDDTTTTEPPNSEPSQGGEDIYGKTTPEVAFGPLGTEPMSATRSMDWTADGAGDGGALGQVDKAEAEFCLPLRLQTDDGAGSPELRGPSEALGMQDAELMTKVTEGLSIAPCAEGPPPGGQSGELCSISEEALDVSATENTVLPQIDHPDKYLSHDENVGVFIGQKETDQSYAAVPNNADAPSVPITNSQAEHVAGGGLSPHEGIKGYVSFTDSAEELQSTCFAEEQQTLLRVTEAPPPDILDHKQSTRDDQAGLQPNAASTESTESGNNRLVPERREDKSDVSSSNNDPQKKAEENEPQEKVDVVEPQGPQCSEISTTNHDLETPGNTCLGHLAEPSPALPEEADGLSRHVSLAKYWPVCQDDVPESLENSELLEEEEPEDNTDSWKTNERPVGAGAECLKCGRRIRRSRKEMVWASICFKCRLLAKRKERLANQSDASEFPVEAHFSRRAEGPSCQFPDQLIKQEEDCFLDPSDILTMDPVTGKATGKLYKCPKCDKAFRIPALLAGHMKCHTLPQCLTCGCPIPLKYKTKRIPRRCQKCVQLMKEDQSADQQSDEYSETSDNEEVSFLDTGAVVQKAKRKNLVKALDDEETQNKDVREDQEEDSSDELDVLADGEKPRLCPQCGKAFKCNRSLNLHLLSHTMAQCESCGCRLQKKRRAGRWSKKCRICKLQSKDQISRESEDQSSLSGDKVSKRLKAKQAQVSQKKKMQSIIKQKKELKWKNMLLAVKKLMNKSRKRKETAAQNMDPAKKNEESLLDESSEASSDKTSIATDRPTPDPRSGGAQEAESSGVQFAPNKTPKQGRKFLFKEKNIIKIEEDENILPCSSDPAISISSAFIKQEETWQCLECNQSMENLEALLSHQPSHIGDQSFTCPQCPQVFSSEEFMNIHIPAHDEKRPFRCPECDMTFSKRNHLGVHMRVHSGMRPFACPDCPRRFRQKATLLAHRYSHRTFEVLLTKPHQCSVCNKSFKQKERLVVHERLHTGECPFSCKDCDKVFPSKARLYVHRKLHKLEKAALRSEQSVSFKEEEGSFHCQDCGKVCSTKASFTLHRRVHKQNTDLRPFYCKECDKAFASKASLSMHLKNHSAHRADSESSPEPKQSFTCKHCDKVCSTKASFALHRKVHQSLSAGEQTLDIKIEDGMPSFACKECDKVCGTKASLSMHSKVHKSPLGKEQSSDDSEAPSFKCKKCTMVFTTKASFVLHKKTHKPAFPSPKRPKAEAGPRSFHCKLCEMVFPTKASLMLHRKAHRLAVGEENPKTDVEPLSYSCKECDKVCATKASFVLHSKVHKLPLLDEEIPEVDSEGSYVCKDCDKVCSTKASYVLHRRVHRSFISDPKADQEESTFQCKECSRLFSSKGRLSFHRFKKHGVSAKDEQSLAEEATAEQPKKVSEDKFFSCAECDMKFAKLKMLVQHEAVLGHRTVVPCVHCGKRFLYKKSLFNHMKICQGKTKGKKLLRKKTAAKRKVPTEGSASGTEEERVQKKRKTEEKKKAMAAGQKLRAKTQLEKPKKANKEKAKAKEKRPKSDGDPPIEDDAKKAAPEKPSDARPERPAEPATKEHAGKEKAVGKVRRVKKEALTEKKVGRVKNWRVMAAATVKKKKLQAVIIGGKKKLLVKKRRIPLKPKPGAKSGQASKEN